MVKSSNFGTKRCSPNGANGIIDEVFIGEVMDGASLGFFSKPRVGLNITYSYLPCL